MVGVVAAYFVAVLLEVLIITMEYLPHLRNRVPSTTRIRITTPVSQSGVHRYNSPVCCTRRTILGAPAFPAELSSIFRNSEPQTTDACLQPRVFNEPSPRERRDRGLFLPCMAKKSINCGVRAGSHHFIRLPACWSVCSSAVYRRLSCFGSLHN